MSEADSNLQLVEIKAALDRGEFEAVFQPIVTLPDRDLLGFEALARWRRGDGQLSPPSSFLEGLRDPTTEARISQVVACKALDAAERLRAQSHDFGIVAVNFAESMLNDAAYAQELISMVRDRNLSPAQLSVEVRETVSFAAQQMAGFEGLERLAAEGVIVAIDDFGAGYASVKSVLAPFVKRVKFDLSLTRAAMLDGRARKLLQHCLVMAEDLELEAVVEGVEDADCEQMLLNIGCKAAQGFFYARPAPLEEVIERLKSGGYAHPQIDNRRPAAGSTGV